MLIYLFHLNSLQNPSMKYYLLKKFDKNYLFTKIHQNISFQMISLTLHGKQS